MPVSRHRVEARLHVVGVAVAERANDRQLVRELSGARQQFAEMHAGYAGINGAKLSALRQRAVGFGVPGLLLCVAAVQVQHDDRTGATKRARARRLGLRLSAEQVGQRQRETASRAKTQYFAARSHGIHECSYGAIPGVRSTSPRGLSGYFPPSEIAYSAR